MRDKNDDKDNKLELVREEIKVYNHEEIDSNVIELANVVKIKVVGYANVREYPNHKSAKIKVLPTDSEVDVIDIVEGSTVQGGNTWYKIEGGFVHFSQVKEV